MVRVSLKNTFIDLSCGEADEEPGSPLPRRQRSVDAFTPTRRARSADCTPQASPEASPEARHGPQLEALGRLLERPLLRSPSPAGARPAGTPRGKARPEPASWGGCSADEESLADRPRYPGRAAGKAHLHAFADLGGDKDPHRCPASSSASCATSDGPASRCLRGDHSCGLPGAAPGDEASPDGPRVIKEYHHKRVPKTVDFLGEFRSAAYEGPPTTIMVRNLPNRLTQTELIAELDCLGFSGAFDFLYVPVDLGRTTRKHRPGNGTKASLSNVGYAFVNFVDPAWAERCMDVFQDHSFIGSGKATKVSVAHVQGLAANLAHYEKAAVNAARLQDRRPVVMASLANACGGLPPAPR